DGLAGRAATTRAAVLAETLASTAQFTPEAAMADAAIAGMTPRAIIALPLVSEDELLGVLEILQPEASVNGFTPRILEPLGALAGLAALALAAERRACDLRVTALRAADAQEEERRRLARDLHDGPALGVAQAAAALEHIDRLIDQQPGVAHGELRQVYTYLMGSLRDLRGILFDLRPLTLEREGLRDALPYLIERRRAGDGPKITLALHLTTRLPLGIETTIYLVIREALTNALRHARATTCAIEVRDTDLGSGRHTVGVVIRDDGVGFAADEMLRQYPHGQSWGLASMVERAHAFTERFAIRSAPGMGTSIEMTIDYSE
nr:GAF domain-containing protein [Ktedonobacterales bacterium]